MNIRYYRRDYICYYAMSDDDTLLINDDGLMYDGWGYRGYHEGDQPWPEIFAQPGLSPDAGPIEERYINATDRPSVEGFKHPDIVEPWL